MQSTSHAFKDNAHGALADERLQKALGKMKVGFQDKRTRAVARLPEFEALRDQRARHQEPRAGHISTSIWSSSRAT